MASDDLPLVTFVWPDAGGARTGIVHLEYRAGWGLKRYLHEQPLRSQGLLGMWKRCRVLNKNRQKVKLNYTPTVGDVIVLTRVRPQS